ncbi:MAG TPA: hypothetical protein VGK44_15125, partial [Casimicrobiaceae bacterium]
MPRQLLASAFLAPMLAFPSVVTAATDADLAEIREQIKQLKDGYEARIRALEERLKAAETGGPATAAPAPPAPAPSGPAASTLAQFNPGISVVLQGTYAHLSQDPTQFAINRFQTSDDVGPGRRGLGLGESEITFFGNVDDKFAGNLTVSLSPDN